MASMFQKHQTANDSQKARETYNAILEKGKQFGLDKAAGPFMMIEMNESICSGHGNHTGIPNLLSPCFVRIGSVEEVVMSKVV